MQSIKEFNTNIINEVLDLEISQNLTKKGAFLTITSSLLEDAGVLEDFRNCFLSKEIEDFQIKLDGYSISESEKENSSKLDLIISLYVESSKIEVVSKEEIKNHYDYVLKAIPIIIDRKVAAVKPSEFNDLRTAYKYAVSSQRRGTKTKRGSY